MATSEPARPHAAKMKARLLAIDDDPAIQELLQLGLTRTEFVPTEARSGAEAIAKALAEPPDVVLLDVMLPDLKGYDVCRRLRDFIDAPIIMLSGLRNEDEIVAGLSAGADDYVTKPFGVGELIARLRAHVRHRPAFGRGRTLSIAGDSLVLDLDRQVVIREGLTLQLSPTDFRLLSYLIANAGRVVSHQELKQQLWKEDTPRLDAALKVYVGRLRQKIERDPDKPRLIVSRRGLGYLLDAPVTPEQHAGKDR